MDVASPIAHIKDGQIHLLEDHLLGTARRAAQMAASFGAQEWAYVAGLWHDLGKYSEAFQKYLHSSEQDDYHAADVKGRVDHSTAGAQHAVRKAGILGHLLAYVISGHHSGLLDGIGHNACLDHRLSKAVDPVPPVPLIGDHLVPALPEFLSRALAKRSSEPEAAAFSFAFFVRMLYSCLVDADFLDTEAFMDPLRVAARPAWPSDVLARMERALDDFVAREFAGASSSVDDWRRTVREACLSAADASPGLFSLTVPTGGGKTLAAMAFALRHATIHGLERVIYVAPFISIIEQNAATYRQAFSRLAADGLPEVVLEHHSEVDVEEETAEGRLAAENWDAPLIVTTAVQFYESLFANRSRRCRKLHNVARAVVILDEAQELPVDYLHPCLLALRELASNYGTTVVLCTATQPAVIRREGFQIGLEGVREIVPDPPSLYVALRRVRVEDVGQLKDDELGRRIEQLSQVLCILNTKEHARRLFALVRDQPGAFHLSAAMCPEHRSEVLERIRAALVAREPCRVIATPVVEAGVDVDFPVVFRALAGLDSVAQAAGRCNRNGRAREGLTYVFRSEHPDREVFLRDTAGAAAQIMGGGNHPPLYPDILSLEAVEHYFRLYYWSQQSRWDARGILDELKLVGSSRELFFLFAFATVAKRFRLIDDPQSPVIVAWGESGRELCHELERSPFPDVQLLRRLQRFTVSVPHRVWLFHNGRAIRIVHGRFPVLCATDFYYHKDTGLNLGRDEFTSGESVL